MSAPARSKQPSRKTKSAWRKNINLEDVTTGLDSARDEVRTTGGQGLLADAPEASLFQTDITGDIGIQRKTVKELGNLKVDEILAQRSAVPAVTGRKRPSTDRTTAGLVAKKQKHGNGVSAAEYKRLRQLAYGNSSALTSTPTSSTADASDTASFTLHDPWRVSQPQSPPPNQSYLTPPPTKKPPSTLSHAPIPLTASGKAPSHIPKPGPSTSYNPVYADWTAALTSAGAAELSAEQKRLAAQQAEQEREARVVAAGLEAERSEIGGYASAGENSEWESEWEGILSASEGEGRSGGRTDLKSKRPSRKTPAERNKVRRRKEAEALHRHEAKMRERDESVKRLDALTRDLRMKGVSEASIEDARANARAVAKVDSGVDASESSDDEVDARQLRKARFGQRAVPEMPLELVLADELESSLRRLRPEGNLLNDRFRNMIVQGRVEARPKPLGQQKLRRVKRTEKWGHKDWSIDDVVK